jgi:Mrp family chromosome partitioning ATPase
MDGKVRAIEPTRLEREWRQEAGLSAEPSITGATTSTKAGLVGSEAIGFTDTFVQQRRVHELEPERRERERILLPGATGEFGAPYKLLRTQVMRRLNELGANTLAVLSPFRGEGKTLTAINLAIAVAADHNHTALLVDVDLRNPSVHQRLGFEPSCGIEDCVQQRRPIHEAMVKIKGYERLTVVPARAPVEQSSELLAMRRMAELVQELKCRYLNRILIFDLPPVLMADDALAFSRHVQAGLLVVTEGRTAREGVTYSLTILNKLPIVGTVLNRSSERSGGYYY